MEFYFIGSGVQSDVACFNDAASNKPFAELAECATPIMALPHSNAEIKAKLRNRLSVKTLNSNLHLSLSAPQREIRVW